MPLEMPLENRFARTSMHRRNRQLDSVLLTLWCLGGCSLRDLDDLNQGVHAATAGTSNSIGGSGATNATAGSRAEAGATALGGITQVGGVAGGTAQETAGSIAMAGATAGAGGTVVQGSAGASATMAISGGTNSAGANGCGGPMVIGVGDPSPYASGLGVLTVPLTAVGQGMRFNYQNYDGRGSYSLACDTLTVVAGAPGATGGDLHIFFTTSKRIDSVAFDVPLSVLANGFQTISIPVPMADVGGFDPADIMVIRFEVESSSAYGTSWATPATVVYIDSISSSNGLFNDTFDATADALRTSGVRTVTGAAVTWTNAYSMQTGAGGTSGTGEGGGGGGGGVAGTATTDHGGSCSAGTAGSSQDYGGACAGNGQAGSTESAGAAG